MRVREGRGLKQIAPRPEPNHPTRTKQANRVPKAISPRLTQTNHRKFCACTEIPYIRPMRTVIETPIFQKQAEKLWSEAERHPFIDWIAEHPLAGDVIKGASGARKVR